MVAVLHAIITATGIFFATASGTGNEAETKRLRNNLKLKLKLNLNQQTLQRGLEDRIVGGSQAELFEYPYYTQWLYGCGAALIHDDILLSAAHCNVIESYDVIIGGYQAGIAGSGSVPNTIVSRIMHPSYNSDDHSSDYLLLKLATPVANKPVKLNRSNSIPATGDNLVVVGLGVLTEDGNTPDFLQAVTVQAVDQQTCNAQYNGGIDETTMLCAGVVGGGKDSCQGDSGGPIVEIINGEPVLVGVVSWGNGCAWASHSGIYSRVSGAIDWIEQQICTFSANPPATCNPNPQPVPAQRPTLPGVGGQSRPKPPPVTPQPTPQPIPETEQPSYNPVSQPIPETEQPSHIGEQQASPTPPVSLINVFLGEHSSSSDNHGLSPALSPTHADSLVTESLLVWTSYGGFAPAVSPSDMGPTVISVLLIEPVS